MKQTLMNKKLYYLGILYKDNSIEVINLYSQMCVLTYPINDDD